MKQSGNKILVIILIVLAVLAIGGGVFAYVYLATDMLRSEKELFAKYLTQNIEELTQTVNLDKIDEIEEKLKQNKHEETITISYTEEGETLPTGTTTIDIQKDPINQKEYGIISLATQEPEETLELEYMYEQDVYSLRFTNAVKQFFSVENSDLKEFATKLGFDEVAVDQIPDVIDFDSISLDKLKFTDEEKSTEINRYANLLYNNIAQEKYTKTKNTVITVNGKTITTNAYTLTLSMQDVKNLVIKILENLKQDEIILAKLQVVDEMIQDYYEEYSDSLKDSFVEKLQEAIDELIAEEITEEKNIVATVYEEDKKTVRVKVEEGLEYITVDTTEVEGKKQIDMNYTNIDEDNTQLSNGITLIKENDNKLIIKLNTVDGEEQQNYEINLELIENGNNVKIDITIDDEDGQTAFSRNINFNEEINYKVTLDNSNNIVINELSLEQISTIFTLVGDKLNTEYVKVFKYEHLAPFKLVAEPIRTAILYNQVPGDFEGITFLGSAEIEAFNAKFMAYEGEEVSTANVNALLNVVFTSNEQEAISATERYVTVSGDVTLEADADVVTEIEGTKLYTVVCNMDEYGLVNEIVITENSSVLDILN